METKGEENTQLKEYLRKIVEKVLQEHKQLFKMLEEYDKGKRILYRQSA